MPRRHELALLCLTPAAGIAYRGPSFSEEAKRKSMVSWTRIVLGVVALGLAVLIVGVTSCGTIVVTNEAELQTVRLGAPLPYIEQNQGILHDPWRTFPLVTRFWSPWENPTTVLWSSWLLDVSIVLLVVVVAFLATREASRRWGD